MGTDPLNAGLVLELSNFDTSKRDGITLPNPAAAMQFAKPHGEMRAFCVPVGIYQIRAVQAETPHRAGQLLLANPQGCSLHATVDKMSLVGDASETGALGYWIAGAWGRQNGTITASPAFGGSYDVCTTPIIDVTSVTAGWDNCSARGGTRVYTYFYGVGVYHSRCAPPRTACLGDPSPRCGWWASRDLNRLLLIPALLFQRRVVARRVVCAGVAIAYDGVQRRLPPAEEHTHKVVFRAGKVRKNDGIL